MEIRQGLVDLYMCHILTPYYSEVVWSHNVAMWLKGILIIGCLSGCSQGAYLIRT